MVDTKNYKKYIAIGSLMMPNSLVGSFRKKNDDSFTCDIIMNDAKVDEAGFITCATTMYPDKAVIYITKDMLEALQQGKDMNDTCADLVDLALRSGGRDNITVVCVRI